MTRFEVQVFSDTTCPWCYLGLMSLDRAMETYKQQHPDAEFEVAWKPFYLFPEAKVSAYPKRDYYLRKFGPSRIAGFYARLSAAATSLGVPPPSFAGTTGNTRDSHRLVLLAQRRSPALGRRLLHAIFEDEFGPAGRDVSDRAFLAEVAAREGLWASEAEALRWLEGGGDGEEGEELGREADEIDRLAKSGKEIEAVPSYVVQGRFRVGGFQEPGVFLGVFERVRALEEEAAAKLKGDDGVLP
ncbi:hypothetical protein NKR23_g3060 [Pleurostoma richardsiae]|uniref:DSBA-like thioredoxin domain-containing protein n=1 Tax=Pleurostoma richardsiae TaxID=41990 RepID=A0AA38S5R8_9PEZI|nr:hypothetical protein NKR23_g3060 [Pleurostoma richardsiae]